MLEQLNSTRQEALEYGTELRDALREGDEMRAKLEQVRKYEKINENSPLRHPCTCTCKFAPSYRMLQLVTENRMLHDVEKSLARQRDELEATLARTTQRSLSPSTGSELDEALQQIHALEQECANLRQVSPSHPLVAPT